MQRLKRSAAAISLAAALSCTAAAAQELVVMPYRCAMQDGVPLLTPSEDHGHRIVGTREQRSFTTCSPADPGLCRQWMLQRFDMDCNGATVPWASVVANAYPDRVRSDGGQLQIRMPPRWTMGPDDPCARNSTYEGGGWRRGRFERYCDDRRAFAAPPYVSLPAGFAPLLGINAVFVAARTPPGQPLAPPGTAYDGMPRGTAPLPPPSAAAPLPVPSVPKKSVATLPPGLSKEATPKADPSPRPEPQPKWEPAPKPEASLQAPPPSAPVVTPLSKPAAPEASPSQPAQPPGTVIIPKIINREPGRDPAPAPIAAEPKPAPAQPTPVTVETPAAVPGGKPATEASGVATYMSGPASSLALALAALGLIAAVGVVAAWRLRAAAPEAPDRDLSSISFGSDARQDVVVSERGGPVRATPPPLPPDFGIGDRMPETRADALRVLGMGVTPAATAAALKKIIDGLRQSWHPDLAQDPDDRELRELRMKQLNAAWEILSPKPAQGPFA